MRVIPNDLNPHLRAAAARILFGGLVANPSAHWLVRASRTAPRPLPRHRHLPLSPSASALRTAPAEGGIGFRRLLRAFLAHSPDVTTALQRPTGMRTCSVGYRSWLPGYNSARGHPTDQFRMPYECKFNNGTLQ